MNNIKYKKLILAILLVVIIAIVSISYGWFNYSKSGGESKVITGSLYLVMNEGNGTLTMEKAFPETKEEARARNDNTITFTVSGKNTSTTKPIVYEILLDEGTAVSGKDPFNTKDLVFDLVEIGANNEETYVLDAVSYDELNDTRIWVDSVDANTTAEIEKTYQLRMWLSDDVLISDTDPNADYKSTGADAFKNHYASVKVAVQGDLVDKVLPLVVVSNDNMVQNGTSYVTNTIENHESESNTYTLEIESSNQNINFVYDEANNTVSNIGTNDIKPKISYLMPEEEGSINRLAEEIIGYDSFEKTFQVASGKKVSFNLKLVSTTGQTTTTDLTYTLKKGNVVIQELVKHVKVLGRSYIIEFVDKEALYTGNPVTLDNVVIKNPNGSIYQGNYTITYHTGNSCSTEALSSAPVEVGVYSEKITVAGTSTTDATTACGKITINNNTTIVTVINANGTYSGEEVGVTTNPREGVTVKYYTDNTCTTLIDSNNETKVPVDAGVYYAKATSSSSQSSCVKHEITAKTLTVSADNKTRSYGAANPTLTYTYVGNVSGETPAFTGSIATIATTDSNADDYAISKGTLALTNGTGFKASNYVLVFVNGTLTITKINSPITITSAQNISFTVSSTQQEEEFTGATATGSGNITYAIESQVLSSTPVEYFTIPSSNLNKIRVAANTPTGVYTVVVRATDSGNNNYNSGYADTTLTIKVMEPATCPNTITAYQGTYDGNSHSITVSNDAVGGTVEYRTATSGEGSTWSSTNPTNTDAGTKTVYIRVLGDSTHSNTDCGSSTITINKKEVTVTADNKSMTYGGSAPSYTYTVTGAIGSETTVTGSATYTIKDGNTTVSNVSTANAGTYSIVPSGLTAGSNYTIAYANGTLTINPGTITGSVSISGTKTWGQTLTANSSCSIPSSGCTFTNYQWYSNGVAINGATSSTYVIPKEQVGHTLSVSVTASATNYSNATLTSSSTSAIEKQTLEVTTTEPSSPYTGSPIGATLTVTSPEWNGQVIQSGTTMNVETTVTSSGVPNTAYTLSPTATNWTGSPVTIYWVVTGGDYYNVRSGSTTVFVAKRMLTSTEITAYSTPWVNGASTYTRTVNGVNGETVSLTYTPYTNTVGTYQYATSLTSGKFTVSQSNTNYDISDAGDLTLTQTWAEDLAYSNASLPSCQEAQCALDAVYQLVNHVNPTKVTVSFSDPALGSMQVTVGGTYGSLPIRESTAEGRFLGWYTASSGGTLVESTTTVTQTTNHTLYARWGEPYKCVRVTSASDLHTETCSQTEHYCIDSNYSQNDTVIYGNAKPIGSPLTPGDAFDCKVTTNGDYTERFYYVSPYFNTDTETFDGDDGYVTLIYSRNFVDGDASDGVVEYSTNSDIQASGGTCSATDGCNWFGPLTAVKSLPTTSTWSNIRLKETVRTIRNELTSGTTNNTTGGSLPASFSYTGYAARLLNIRELYSACNILTYADDGTLNGSLNNCQFFNERTQYTDSTKATLSLWLENARSTTSTQGMLIAVARSYLGYTSTNVTRGVRPAIDVLKSDLLY